MRNVVRSSLPKEIKKSLDYCWKEGAAAQVMISAFDNYLTPYALFLGASTQQIGLLVAIPSLLSSTSQIFAVNAVRAAGSRHSMLTFTTGVQAILLIPVVLLAFLPPAFDRALLLILLVAVFRLLGSLIGPAWGSLVSDYLPEGQRGQYLGWRSRMVAISGITSTAFWGLLLYIINRVSPSPALGFVLIFSGAVVSRFISFSLMSRLTDLPLEHKRESDFTLWMFLQRFRESNFVKFIFYVAGITFATQMATPYLSVHMLKNLQFNYLSYMSVQLASVVAGLIAFPLWGRDADIVGNAKVLKTTGFIIPLVPVLWMFARDPVTLVLVEMFSGFIWSGFTLASANFIYDSVSPAKRVRCLGYYNLINATAIFLGASLGGFLAERLPSLLGYRLVTLFLVSAVLRSLSDLILSRHFGEVRESARKVSSVQLFFSVAGIKPLAGENTELDIYPPLRPPRKNYHTPPSKPTDHAA